MYGYSFISLNRSLSRNILINIIFHIYSSNIKYHHLIVNITMVFNAE